MKIQSPKSDRNTQTFTFPSRLFNEQEHMFEHMILC